MPFRELQERIAELERRMSNMLFYGVVIEAKENKVKVAQGDLVTGWIPVFQAAAGTNESIFTPIENGEMVCVVCPNGSIENGAAIRGLNYNSNPVPKDAAGKIVINSSHKIQIEVTNSEGIEINTNGSPVKIVGLDTTETTLGCAVTDKSPCPVFGGFHQSPSRILKTTLS